MLNGNRSAKQETQNKVAERIGFNVFTSDQPRQPPGRQQGTARLTFVTCQILASVAHVYRARDRESVVLVAFFAPRALASRMQADATARWQSAEVVRPTPQPTSTEHTTVKHRGKVNRHTQSLAAPRIVANWADFSRGNSADRGPTMTIIETLPGETNASLISSIINLICPQCGGSMMEFQCSGRCRRNWLAEWEWANHTTRNANAPHSQRSSRP